MTHTTTYIKQTLTWSTAKKAEKPKLPEIEENICDMRSVCESLNRLCETLSRLNYFLSKEEPK
jgi:hypothetical protein